jgi:hypothetical protein
MDFKHQSSNVLRNSKENSSDFRKLVAILKNSIIWAPWLMPIILDSGGGNKEDLDLRLAQAGP